MTPEAHQIKLAAAINYLRTQSSTPYVLDSSGLTADQVAVRRSQHKADTGNRLAKIFKRS